MVANRLFFHNRQDRPLLYSSARLTEAEQQSQQYGLFLRRIIDRGKKRNFSAVTIYNKFNGAHSNYDDSQECFDNNTLYALVWLMF